MRINQGIDLLVQTDPLSFTAEIQVLTGTLNQTYDQENKTYDPDRSLFPLKLLPVVHLADLINGDQSLNREAEISSVTWYYLNKGERTRLTGRAGYTVDSSNPNMLVVTANTPAETRAQSTSLSDAPSEIIAEIHFIDPRTQTAMVCERSIQVHTTYFVAHSWRVEMNQPSVRRIDPTRWKPRTSVNVLPVTVRTTLYDNDTAMRDFSEDADKTKGESQSNVAYFWQYWDKDFGWQSFNENCYWLITPITEDPLMGTIEINGEAIEELKIRCYAQHYVDERPSAPSSASRFAETLLKRQLPPTSYAKVIADKGMFIDFSNEEKEVVMRVELYDNNGPIENIDQFYRVEWFAQSHAKSATEKDLGKTGATLTVKVKDLKALGFTRTQGIRVFPKIYELGAFMPIEVGVGISAEGYTTSKLLTTSNGEFIVAQKINK